MIHSSAVLVALALLAITRLTRLINADVILDRPRAWIQRTAPDSIAYLVQCAWCASIYVAAGVACAVYFEPTAWWVQIPLLAAAGSYVAGLGATLVAALEAEKE